ncbi:MAG TPA: ceramidase domain-containing protein [Burkholderiales bacterium]|jgi:hypothetical protein|nr:ceramidase domain-containing protein [Burkholderiales bacterium]
MLHPGSELDLYCERLSAGLWAEPLNALSNLAFFVAAYLLLRQADADRTRRFLAVLIALVGVGSLAFHMAAQVWAHWLDLLFIELFIYSYIALYLRAAFAFSIPKVIIALLAFAVFEWRITGLFEPGTWNDSYRYLPALLALIAMACGAIGRKRVSSAPLIAAAAVFVVAVILRSLDLALCANWPWGTHFIWHTLNAAVLYLGVIAMRGRPGANKNDID